MGLFSRCRSFTSTLIHTQIPKLLLQIILLRRLGTNGITGRHQLALKARELLSVSQQDWIAASFLQVPSCPFPSLLFFIYH